MGSRSPAGPRRLGTATRISASLFRRLSAFFGSAPDQGPKAAKFAVLIPGRAGFPNCAKRSEGSDSAPIQNAPVSPCDPLCARLGAGVACTRRSLLKRALRRLWAMCERVRCILLRQWETEPFGMDVPLPAKSRFGGFRPLFTRSIKAQTGYNLSSRNLIWDAGRVGLVVSHNGVNDGDHLPAGVAHGRHVGLPFIPFFLEIKLQRRIVKYRR